MSLGKFVHTSDLHLGSPFAGIEASAPHVAAALRQATYETLDRIVRLCVTEKVDGLLVAGDVFDVRSLQSQLEFQKALRKLDEAGIRSFVCHGNHDALDQWEARLDLPSTCHRFGADPESLPLNPERPGDVVITGVSYPTRDVRRNLAATFVRPAEARFAVGLLHANVIQDVRHEAYAACRVEDLTCLGYGYWALGHIHEREVIQQDGVTVSYSGAPQGLNRKQSGPKGVNLVTISDEGHVDLAFRETSAIRWESASISLTACESEQELLDLVRATVDELRKTCVGRRLVYDIAVVGTTPLHTSLHRVGFVDEVSDALNREYGAVEPWAWCAALSAATTAPFDRQQRAGGKDFIAALLRLVDAAEADAEVLKTVTAGCEELVSDPRFQSLIERPLADEWKALLRDAETMCLDGLEAEAEE